MELFINQAQPLRDRGIGLQRWHNPFLGDLPLPLVLSGLVDAAGMRLPAEVRNHILLSSASVTSLVRIQGRLFPHCGLLLVVLHPDHDLFLHGQPGRLPDHREDGQPHLVRGGPRQADQDRIRVRGVGINGGLLQGKPTLPRVCSHFPLFWRTQKSSVF